MVDVENFTLEKELQEKMKLQSPVVPVEDDKYISSLSLSIECLFYTKVKESFWVTFKVNLRTLWNSKWSVKWTLRHTSHQLCVLFLETYGLDEGF